MSGLFHKLPDWDSWEEDILEAERADAANSGKGKGQGKDKDINGDEGKGAGKDGSGDGNKGQGAQHLGKGKVTGKGKVGADKGKTKNKSKPCGWNGPYVNVVGRVYWTWRTYKPNGQSKTHRYYEDDGNNSE